MHTHYCDVAGHEYECSDESCACLCGMAMESNAHDECPIELRACAEHVGRRGLTAEAEPDAVKIDFNVLSAEHQQSRPHCDCGCADIAPSTGVAFCLWCDHVYADYSPETEARHFARHCTGAPETLKEAKRKWLAGRKQ